jgi:hypothetical protein
MGYGSIALRGFIRRCDFFQPLHSADVAVFVHRFLIFVGRRGFELHGFIAGYCTSVVAACGRNRRNVGIARPSNESSGCTKTAEGRGQGCFRRGVHLCIRAVTALLPNGLNELDGVEKILEFVPVRQFSEPRVAFVRGGFGGRDFLRYPHGRSMAILIWPCGAWYPSLP